MISPKRIVARFLEGAAEKLTKAKVQGIVTKAGLKPYKSAPGLAGAAGDGGGDFKAYEWDGDVIVVMNNPKMPKAEKETKLGKAKKALEDKGLTCEEKKDSDGAPSLIVKGKA